MSVTGEHVRKHVIEPMLDLLDAFVTEAHRKDPHPYGHHNHHLCIQVTEWHNATSQNGGAGVNTADQPDRIGPALCAFVDRGEHEHCPLTQGDMAEGYREQENLEMIEDEVVT